MNRPIPWLAVAACLASSPVLMAAENGPASQELAVRATQNTKRLMPYQVFELTLQHEGEYHDPNWDVTIDVVFRGRGGREARVGGFFYGSSKPQKPVVKEWKDDKGRTRSSAAWPCEPADLWKARYAPREPGRWTYEYALRNDRGGRATGQGSFEVVRGKGDESDLPRSGPPGASHKLDSSPFSRHQRGWLRINPENPFRFVFDDGTPFFPVGFQDGLFDANHNGSCLDSRAVEGPFRLDGAEKRPKPPPGAMFARGPSMNPQNGDVQFGRHSRAGINLLRFSPHNFSIEVFTLDRVNWAEAALVDELLQSARKYDMRVMYGIFGFCRAHNDDPQNAPGMAKVKRIIKYSVDRWGAYADIDADGRGDDRNGNGLPDCEEKDPDGDGVPTADAVPWDAFPRDPTEWRDTDGDGTGDNADPDDDGDGYTDQEERAANTDPLDPLSFPPP